MDIFSVLTLLGGLAFFLYGMNVLSTGLERMAGGKLEGILKKMTSNRFKSLALGAIITAVIQSSSAMTVMLVGLVNSGIMTIRQSIGVIMGSNIGTTITAWFLSLVQLESNSVFTKMLKPENFSLVFAFVGILLIMMSKSSKKKDIGSIMVGFAILMYGMKQMGDAVKPLAEVPEFTNLLTAFNNPILGVVVGALITAAIQSSSASVGILQALSLTGGITYGMAFPIIMGQNIGTCVTALISSIGVGRNAKKVSVVHVSFNVIGTVVCLCLYGIANLLFDIAIVNSPIDAAGIAVVHSLFNIFTTFMLLPFIGLLENIANFVLKDNGEKDKVKTNELLDSRLLATPSVAIMECDALTTKMSVTAKETLLLAIDSLKKYRESDAEKIIEMEDILDRYEDKLGTYLVQLSSKKLSEEDSKKVSKMLHSIGDFERLGDHAVNILKTAKELHDKQLSFSEAAEKELAILVSALKDILVQTTAAYESNDTVAATDIEPLEQVIDKLVDLVKARHIKRLQGGSCSIEMGFILSDLLNNFERVSDHCSNIAVSIIEIEHNAFDTHKYLSGVKHNDEKFKESFARYSKKYVI
mgnify:CR=1 FL=1